METTINFIRGVVTLDEQTYRDFLGSQNVMKRGFLIFLACFFFAMFPVFGQTLIAKIQGLTPEEAALVQDEFISLFEQFQPAESDEMFMEMFRQNFVLSMNIGVEIEALPTLLPKPIADFLQALGAWVSASLRPIFPWLAYGALVLLLAKLAGGPAVLNPFFGLTALFAIPNLLRILGFIPFLGPVLELVALIWGLAVYIRAVQISQEFSGGKAVLITLLPLLVLFLLVACSSTAAVATLVGLAAGGQ
ncbi:MAG: hypothetical protein ACK2U5_10940 [Candidatus Promineifilaceae bacterium]|jgi:hypothetical protein